ncbi:hypothetical protein PUR49_10105 [Streptomyces sp. BE147]|uniref:DUF6801 domain-containing protein n=1 Tax=Streptomyces sp. BE147 TaxID=3002524 RepID=UPI002E77FEE7|nr:DUF6801 domain-containing protein [Streptomyces sp. BE147]MEE1736850.1 hypothetical protein [Streptomyces sp. BE147]
MNDGDRTARGTRGFGACTALGIAAALATAALGVTGSPTASAEPVGLTLRYACAFSGLGNQPVTMRLDSDIPDSIRVGRASPRSALNGVATVSAGITRLAAAVGAKTVEGSLDGTATVTAPQGDIPLAVPMTIPRTAVPASGSFDVTAKGTAPSLTFIRPGNAKVRVGDLTLSLTPKRANGTTPVGQLHASCTVAPGQHTVLQSLAITEPVQATATATGGNSAGGTGGGSGSGATGGGTGSGSGPGTTAGTATGTRPGTGTGRSASASSDASATQRAPAPSATGTAPRTPSASRGAPAMDTPQDDATNAAIDSAADDLNPRNPFVLVTGVLVVAGAAALVALGPWLRKRHSDGPDS